MAQFCTKCGSEIEPGSKFCIKCGEKIENILPEKDAIKNASVPVEHNKSTGNNNKIVIPLIIAVLLIGGIGGYFLFGRSSDDNRSVAQSQQNAPATQVQKEKVPVKPAPPAEEKTGFIVGVNVNAREKASTDSAIVGTFSLGEKVAILADETEWAKVKRADGKECYVFKKFLGDQAALDKRQAKYNIKSGPYPVFLNGDPNYILVDAQMGSAWYIIRNSVQYDAQKNIMCNVVSVGDADKGNVSASEPIRYLFYFNEKDKMAGVWEQYGLRPFKYDGPRSVTMVKNRAGAMAYYIATGKKWSKFGFSDDVYSPADL